MGWTRTEQKCVFRVLWCHRRLLVREINMAEYGSCCVRSYFTLRYLMLTKWNYLICGFDHHVTKQHYIFYNLYLLHRRSSFIVRRQIFTLRTWWECRKIKQSQLRKCLFWSGVFSTLLSPLLKLSRRVGLIRSILCNKMWPVGRWCLTKILCIRPPV